MEKENLISIINQKNTRIRVSSILDNNGKEFGGSKILDNNSDTCWSSNQGNTQSLIIEFVNLEINKFNSIHLTSQGGFCPKNISVFIYLESLTNNAKQFLIKKFDEDSIKDTSETQILKFKDEDFNSNSDDINLNLNKIYGIRLFFDKFYDLYGRVTLYDLKIY